MHAEVHSLGGIRPIRKYYASANRTVTKFPATSQSQSKYNLKSLEPSFLFIRLYIDSYNDICWKL